MSEECRECYPLICDNILGDCNYIKNFISEIKADAYDEFISKFVSRNQLKQMTKSECINAMYVLAGELREQIK